MSPPLVVTEMSSGAPVQTNVFCAPSPASVSAADLHFDALEIAGHLLESVREMWRLGTGRV